MRKSGKSIYNTSWRRRVVYTISVFFHGFLVLFRRDFRHRVPSRLPFFPRSVYTEIRYTDWRKHAGWLKSGSRDAEEISPGTLLSLGRCIFFWRNNEIRQNIVRCDAFFVAKLQWQGCESISLWSFESEIGIQKTSCRELLDLKFLILLKVKGTSILILKRIFKRFFAVSKQFRISQDFVQR